MVAGRAKWPLVLCAGVRNFIGWEPPMTPTVMILLGTLAAYVGTGIVIAVAFVVVGIARVLPPSTPVTIGARILLLPGAAALWPFVLTRWLKARRVR
jgi:hypothetical protein